VAWCVRRKTDWLVRSVKASLVVQTISYVVMFSLYCLASGTAIYTRTHLSTPAEMDLPQSVVVYYINVKDGDVYRRPLVGGEAKKIFDLHSKDQNDRLLVKPSAAVNGTWDLVARLDDKDDRNPPLITVVPNMPVQAVLDTRATLNPPDYAGTWFNFGDAPKLGDANDERWKFSTGFWSVEGLSVENIATGKKEQYSYETPFGNWTVRNAVHLPTNKVLFQLGHDQICAFDPVTRRIALLWHGRGPVPVIERAVVP
ncbi:MAG: hypothetical protein ABI615_06210, partial [Chthoniobacterales bacterium]